MINANRIVPITKEDLISMYGLIIKQNSSFSALAKLAAATIDGEFTVTTNNGILMADQPVKKCNIAATASSVSACTVFFVADYAYEGFSIDGVAEEPASGSVDVVADGHTLYKAVLASGDITITKVGF